MGLDFQVKDFLYPFSIIKLKKEFDKNQWLNQNQLHNYQLQRLKIILNHAYENIPYYQKIFRDKGIYPQDIKKAEDLKLIPPLTKEILIKEFDNLKAKDFKKYKPTLQKTSGTTGGQVRFYTDKSSNILEFVYYWRFWGWAGYRLGDRFAELSAQFFTPYKKNTERICHFNYFTQRLMVNSLLISIKNLDKYITIFKKYRPIFLKGLPSNLYVLALIFNERKNHGIAFKAIFSQGENLLYSQRTLIEKVFSCKVFDSYGLMERVAAISECAKGSYHIHPDYSLIEFERLKFNPADGFDKDEYIAEVIGTSLHNFSMPLIRYRTGDYVKIKENNPLCSCSKTFPIVQGIVGRESDVIVTPDKRYITALYVVLDRTKDITFGQIIQEKIDTILVKIVCLPEKFESIKKNLITNIRDFVGTDMKIKVVSVTKDEIKANTLGKFKSIISNISYKENLN